METLLVITFAAALLLGALTARTGIRRKRPAIRLAAVHGMVASAALLLLGYRVFTGAQNFWFNSAFFLFLLAFLGGLLMLLVRRRDEPPFLALIVLHASMAIVAFLVLLGGLGAV